MAKKALRLEGVPNPKQDLFLRAVAPRIAYGGARGGGKSWVLRRKFILLALRYPHLKLLLLRRTLAELDGNHTQPLLKELNGFAKYTKDNKTFTFPNGSTIKLGYCDTDNDVYQYQGQEYDVIGFEEATAFTEWMLTYIATSCRSTRTDFSPRIYYTCNPGGPGHDYIKRLFIDRQYEHGENPDDYVFIQAKVTDNTVLMETNPGYIKTLEALPEHLRKAYLDGRWDAVEGQYFSEFNPAVHVCAPFSIPRDWRRFRAMDWGYNDPCCVLWFAVAPDSHLYVYREIYQNQTAASEMAKLVKKRSVAFDEQGNQFTEHITYTAASPDMWQKRGLRDAMGGETVADTFIANGVPIIKADNDRMNGWMRVRENLQIAPDGRPYVQIFSTCRDLIRTLPLLTYDKNDHEDVSDNCEDHACLTGDTLVETLSGPVPIRELVGKDGAIVTTENGSTRSVGWFRDCRMTRPSAEVFEVQTDAGSFKATGDHKVLLEGGTWKQVKDLTDADSIVKV